MLAVTQIENTEATVYTCPSEKTAFIYVDVFSTSASFVEMTVKINDVVYWSGSMVVWSCKLSLDAGDTVKISTPAQVNVFVHGIEV